MVCGLPASAGFQPALPTASREAMKPMMRVSSRKKCVCMSMMNWPLSALARALAISGVCASARLTMYIGPNVSFIATKAAAMPAEPWKKRRRDMPWCLASSLPMALTRVSNSRCLAVWGPGKNSSLENGWVGIGERKVAVSAGISRASSSGESMGGSSGAGCGVWRKRRFFV